MSALTNLTKHDSYELTLENINGLTHQRQRVLKALGQQGYLTRRELHEMTSIGISSLCSGLKSLIQQGWVREAFDSFDQKTQRNVVNYTLSNDAEELYMNADGGIGCLHDVKVEA